MPRQSALPQPTLFAIDPATGALRTVASTGARNVAVIGPAHRGVIARALADPPAVQQLDPTGNVVWSHPLRADNPPEIDRISRKSERTELV